MTVAEAIKKAVETGNAAMAGVAADALRNRGWDYEAIYQTAKRFTGVSPADWEALMYESEVT